MAEDIGTAASGYVDADPMEWFRIHSIQDPFKAAAMLWETIVKTVGHSYRERGIPEKDKT